jgi:hypothetical protein
MIAQSDEAKKAQQAIGKCEKAIKALILLYALSLMSQDSLLRQIRSLVLAMAKDFPKDLDAKPYEEGMWKSALGWKRVLGDSMREKVAVAKSIDPSLPKDPAKLIAEAKKAKLAPTTIETEDLGTALNKRILKVAQDEPLAIPSQATKPLDAWGAAESEVRGKEQERMVGEWAASKGDLGIISVHLNCSERCFPDQGKIISKTLPAIDSSLWTGKTIDGKRIYSWPAMHARTDKYGYHNFIIDGFNCRHSIKPYVKGDIIKRPPKAETAEVSEAEQAMRSMERALRRQWQSYDMMRKADPAKAAKIKSSWDAGIKNYEAFSIKSGLEPQEWRCKTA